MATGAICLDEAARDVHLAPGDVPAVLAAVRRLAAGMPGVADALDQVTPGLEREMAARRSPTGVSAAGRCLAALAAAVPAGDPVAVVALGRVLEACAGTLEAAGVACGALGAARECLSRAVVSRRREATLTPHYSL